MNINGREYGFSIEPTVYGKVMANIYRIEKYRDGEPYYELLISKGFGSSFRGIKDKDYECAKEWVDSHFENIRQSNKH